MDAARPIPQGQFVSKALQKYNSVVLARHFEKRPWAITKLGQTQFQILRIIAPEDRLRAIEIAKELIGGPKAKE